MCLRRPLQLFPSSVCVPVQKGQRATGEGRSIIKSKSSGRYSENIVCALLKYQLLEMVSFDFSDTSFSKTLALQQMYHPTI